MKKCFMGLFDLIYRKSVIVRCDWYVSTINDSQVHLKSVDFEGDVITPIKSQTSRPRANPGGAKSGTRSIRCTSIKGCTEESDVERNIFS